MNPTTSAAAQACLNGAANDTMTFPQIVSALSDAGFESYAADFRKADITYYLPNGESVVLPSPIVHSEVAAAFDAEMMRAAIREAQELVPGYTYEGFCAKAAAAGCAGYMVSFPGRRALYFGRTAETHVEMFSPLN